MNAFTAARVAQRPCRSGLSAGPAAASGNSDKTAPNPPKPRVFDVAESVQMSKGGWPDGRPRDEKGEMVMTKNAKVPALVGAGVGLALFLAVALLPALLYGGYAGVMLAGGIFGTPVTASFAARALIVFGMVLGVTAVGSLFAVAGAAAGAAIGAIIGLTPASASKKATEKA